jgi:hypothetical protein
VAAPISRLRGLAGGAAASSLSGACIVNVSCTLPPFLERYMNTHNGNNPNKFMVIRVNNLHAV